MIWWYPIILWFKSIQINSIKSSIKYDYIVIFDNNTIQVDPVNRIDDCVFNH